MLIHQLTHTDDVQENLLEIAKSKARHTQRVAGVLWRNGSTTDTHEFKSRETVRDSGGLKFMSLRKPWNLNKFSANKVANPRIIIPT